MRAASTIALLLAAAPVAAHAQRFDAPGNILISDQFNNRVIEVDPGTSTIVFQFGTNNGAQCNPGPGAIIAPNDAERLRHGMTLMPGTGTSTCADNRVIVVDKTGRIVWQYGQAGVTGSGRNELNVPVFAVQTTDGNFLITDQGNNRIIEVDSLTHHIIWSYGPASGNGALNSPNSAEELRNGDILIADENNSRVLEIDRAGTIVWQYSQGLNVVGFASRLADGDTLIADSGNNRIVEIDRSGGVPFQCYTNTAQGSNANPNPTGALRLVDGNTIIADQFNNRVIVVDPQCNLLYQYGQTNVAGNGANQLNAPYSATVIGQYVGVTPPPRSWK
jgi:outer membrane protein assembly factor BamB